MERKMRLGMILFIASEAVFFILLILAFVVYHRRSGNIKDMASLLDIGRTAVFTACLISSSLTAWLAERSQRAGRRGPMLALLGATIGLGAIFLVGQGWEYTDLIQRNVTISRDLFGTTFFTLTGFHGLHVFTGLIMLSVLLGYGLRWPGAQPRRPGTVAVSLYWHFVDAVWLVIFPVVYLWGAL